MKEYLLSVVAVSVIGGFLSMLAYGNYSKVIKGAVGVVLALVILTPFFSLSDILKDISNDIPMYESYPYENGYYKASEEAFGAGIQEAVAYRFGLMESDIAIRVADFDMESMRAGEIYLVLSGSSVAADLVGIKGYVKENFVDDGGRCEVEIKIG